MVFRRRSGLKTGVLRCPERRRKLGQLIEVGYRPGGRSFPSGHTSLVAVLEGGEPVVITTAEGSRLLPSVVAFTKTGERLVGQMAKRQSVVNPENTVFSIKRFMGRRFSEVAEERQRVPYQMVEGPAMRAFLLHKPGRLTRHRKSRP